MFDLSANGRRNLNPVEGKPAVMKDPRISQSRGPAAAIQPIARHQNHFHDNQPNIKNSSLDIRQIVGLRQPINWGGRCD